MGKKRKLKNGDAVDPAAKAQELSENSVAERDSFEVAELSEREEVLFVGIARLQVLEGAVELAGARIQEGQEPLTIIADAQLGGPLLLCATYPFKQAQVPLALERRAVLRLTSMQLSSNDPNQPAISSYKLYRPESLETPSLRAIPPEWHQAVKSLAEASVAVEGGKPPNLRIAVAGTRQIGKSSFARLLVNRLLAEHSTVAYLDTDLGQPELTVPGLVSLSLITRPLLGPPHLHQQPPAASRFVGDVSPQHEPQLYARAVTSLCSWFQDKLAATDEATGMPCWPPLVINTHGWIQGTGLELLGEIFSIALPTHVAMLQSATPRRNLPLERFWQGGDESAARPTQLISLPGIGPQGTAADFHPELGRGESGKPPLAAVEVRSLAWLAFARRCCGLPGAVPEWDTAAFAAASQALAAQPPYSVSAGDLRMQMLRSAVTGSCQAAAVLNCSIVGLATAAGEPAVCSTSQGEPLECLGVGIVRAVDASKQRLYILTDVPPKQLERVQVLQVGRLELPTNLLQTAEIRSPYLCLWSISAEGSGAGAIKSRNNLIRLSQL